MFGRRRWSDRVEVPNPGRPTPGFVRWFNRWLRPLVLACHRPKLSGTENLPADRPFVLVANHSAGVGSAELLSFITLYLDKVGPDRPLAGFVLPADFHVFPLTSLVRGLGCIPSTYSAAADALAAGVPILVFPGGDHESLKPFWQGNRVDFGGRVGFLRIAKRAGVPVIPMGIRGGHMTGPILLRSKFLATLLLFPRLIGCKRWGISLQAALVSALLIGLLPFSWPVTALIVWLWLGSPLTFVPFIPWSIRIRIGKPIQPTELFGQSGGGSGELSSDEVLDERGVLAAALVRVQAEVQALAD